MASKKKEVSMPFTETNNLLRDVHQTLKIQSTEQAVFNGEFKHMLNALTKVTDDHERRIRWLERSVYIGIAVLMVVRIIMGKA